MSTISLPIKGDADKKLGAYNAPLMVTAQDMPNMTVRIRAGAFYNSNGDLTEYTGGVSPQITAPQTHARWSIVGITNQGSVSIVHGDPQPLPQFPCELPQGFLPLAALYITATTTSINNAVVQDIRPFLRAVDPVENVDQQLADRPTFTDMNNALDGKADVDGTPNTEFTLNKNFVAGSPTSEARISVRRGSYSSPAIRWSETAGRWEISNDGSTFGAIATSEGMFAPLHHTHPSSDITDLTKSIQTIVSDTPVSITQVTGLKDALASKAAEDDFAAHAADTSIHHKLPLSQDDVSGLTDDLSTKADLAGALFTGDITVQVKDYQPITITSDDEGSSGIRIDRRGDKPNARFEWDESSEAWLLGVVGNMNTVVTGNRAVLSVNGKVGEVTLTHSDVGAAATIHKHVAADVTDFADAVKELIPEDVVTKVNGKEGDVVLNNVDVGAAATIHTHIAADVTDFSEAVKKLIPDDVVVSVNGKEGTVVLTNTDVGAAATVHKHVAADVTDFADAVKDLLTSNTVTSVNNKEGVVVLSHSDVGAAATVHKHIADDVTDFTDAVQKLIPTQIVTTVNGRTGTIVLSPDDVGAAADVHTHIHTDIVDFEEAARSVFAGETKVVTINNRSGDVTLTHTDVGAAATVHTHLAADVTDFADAVQKLLGGVASPVALAVETDYAPINYATQGGNSIQHHLAAIDEAIGRLQAQITALQPV